MSTNSITQGEQVGVLWSWLLARGIKIRFAHRTFRWSNEARGVAAVHCVIIGFGTQPPEVCTLYDYQDIAGEGQARTVSRINPYLVEASDSILSKRSQPICGVPEIKFGNQPIDGGHLILSEDERAALLEAAPEAAQWVRSFLGADEYINGMRRYCLWLKDAPATAIRKSVPVRLRVEAVKTFRLESKRSATRDLAATPSRFAFVSHEECDYIIVPSVSSERRAFIPIGFLPAATIASNLCLIVPNAKRFHFGVLTSTMHMAWIRTVCGRLKSDFRYSAGIVYNNFPWPIDATDKQRAAIEQAAQTVLDTRLQFPGSTLADLYDPLTMPPALLKAHQTLDRAVDAAYGRKSFSGDAERVAFLFEQYQKLTSLLPAAKPVKASRKKPM